MARYKITCEIKGEVRHFAGYQAESFSNSGPIWNKGLTERSKLLDDEVDKALDQLMQMGYAASKTLLIEKRKKGLNA